MTATPHLEVLRLREATAQQSLSLATDGVLRYVWEHRFGEMLIEVVDDQVFVNGGLVTPAAADGAAIAVD